MLASDANFPPPWVQVPELFVVTTHIGNDIQAIVVQNEGGASALPPDNHTVRKDVLIKGSTAPTTSKALEMLLRHTEDILASKWPDYMRIPLGQNPVQGPNGAVHYKK